MDSNLFIQDLRASVLSARTNSSYLLLLEYDAILLIDSAPWLICTESDLSNSQLIHMKPEISAKNCFSTLHLQFALSTDSIEIMTQLKANTIGPRCRYQCSDHTFEITSSTSTLSWLVSFNLSSKFEFFQSSTNHNLIV